MKTFKSALLAVATLALASACELPQKQHNATPLVDSSAAKGFDWSTSKPVELHLATAHAGALRISNAKGQLMFSGTLTPTAPLSMKLPLAVPDQKLIAELRVGGVGKTVELPIVKGVAAHAFE